MIEHTPSSGPAAPSPAPFPVAPPPAAPTPAVSSVPSAVPSSERAEGGNPEGNWFGYRSVDPDDKAGMVRAVFDSVAGKYDLMNDLMSAGVHRLWKDALMAMIRPTPAMTLLDVAGGTGDIAFRFRRAGGGPVVVCDLTEAMVRVGRDRAIDQGLLSGIGWSVGNAESLPLADRSVDAYTIAFGLRNVTRIDVALREAARVLKPGGRFFCLEFSRVTVPGLKELYDLYSFQALPRLGRLIAGDAESYQYLAESIRQFPAQQELARRVEAAGFAAVRVRNLSGGIAAIHSGWRV